MRERLRLRFDHEDVAGPNSPRWIRSGDPDLVADQTDDLGVRLVEHLLDLRRVIPTALAFFGTRASVR